MAPTTSRPTVVICEDRPELAQLVALWLDGGGLQTIAVVNSASSAVASCARCRPDMIILDNQLPGQTGLDVVADLRQVSPETHIVLWTADDDVQPDVPDVDLWLSKDDFAALDGLASRVAASRAS